MQYSIETLKAMYKPTETDVEEFVAYEELASTYEYPILKYPKYLRRSSVICVFCMQNRVGYHLGGVTYNHKLIGVCLNCLVDTMDKIDQGSTDPEELLNEHKDWYKLYNGEE